MPGNHNGENRKKKVSFKEQDKSNSQNSHLDRDTDDENEYYSLHDEEIFHRRTSFLNQKNDYNNNQYSSKKYTSHDYSSEFNNFNSNDDDNFYLDEDDEENNHIVIDNYDSEDEEVSNSIRKRFLKASGAQNLPDVVIYAYLSNSSSTTPNLASNVFNDVLNTLTSPKIKMDYYSPKGLSVTAPHSGQDFTLREDRTLSSDKGVTSASYTFRGQTPPSDQVIALTVMNMIENVISKGNPLNLRTNNPFVAQITKLYVEKLIESGLNINYTPPENINLNDSKNSNAISTANEVFGKINTQMKIENLNNSTPKPPWYAAAMEACEPKSENNPKLKL